MEEFIKDLEYGTIQKASEKYENIVEAFISLEIEGQQVPFKVEMYKVFSPVAIKECVMELIEKMELAQTHKRKVRDGIGSIVEPFTMFLCIKHFTTLKLPEIFEEQVIAIKNMLNTSALLQIYMNFDPEQLKILNEEVSMILENFENNMEFIQEYKKEFYDKVSDKSLLEF